MNSFAATVLAGKHAFLRSVNEQTEVFTISGDTDGMVHLPGHPLPESYQNAS